MTLASATQHAISTLSYKLPLCLIWLRWGQTAQMPQDSIQHMEQRPCDKGWTWAPWDLTLAMTLLRSVISWGMWNALVGTWQVKNRKQLCQPWLAFKDCNSKVPSIIYSRQLKVLGKSPLSMGMKTEQRHQEIPGLGSGIWPRVKYYSAGLKGSFSSLDPGSLNGSYSNGSFPPELRSSFWSGSQCRMFPGSREGNKEQK